MTVTRGAWSLLAGFTLLWLGVAWDGQWHIDVGPDTFFTAPHLVFYAGSGLIGFASLAVILAASRDRAAPAGRSVDVGRVRAPVAFLISGLGAAGHLLYGATDLWWHGVYGFDILELTPSHIGLQLSMQTEAVGVVLAFVALRSGRAGRWGLALAASLFVASASISFDGEILGVPLTLLGVGGCAVWVLGVIAGTGLGGRWLVTTAGVFVGLFGVTMLFPVYATQVYADAIDLRMRDAAIGVSVVGLATPFLFPVAAAVTAGVIRLARRRGFTPRRTVPVVGAVLGPVVAAPLALPDGDSGGYLPALLLVAAVGAALCWFGWQNAELLRTPRLEVAAR